MVKGRYGRKDKLIKEERHDTYRSRVKFRDGTFCTECDALYEGGRWVWGSIATGEIETVCPACRRIKDRYPAGYIRIKGSFFGENREEIINLIRNIEGKEKSSRPLQRIMDISEEKGSITVTTTGIHIARRIGDALYNSYQGELDMNYEEGQKRIRVNWER